jgi:uncharacterized protein YjbI with pentapeptide repeats
MEWLVANKAADRLRANETASALISRTMSDLMLDFLCDLASHDVARTWAATVLADTDAQGGGVPGVGVSDHAKQNALAITRRLSSDAAAPPHTAGSARRNLAGIDLRGQDLTGQDLTGADLRGADLRGMRLAQVRLDTADLRDADFTGVRLIGGSLAGALLAGSLWRRAALLGVGRGRQVELVDQSTSRSSDTSPATSARWWGWPSPPTAPPWPPPPATGPPGSGTLPPAPVG